MGAALHVIFGLNKLIHAFSKERQFNLSDWHEQHLSLDEHHASAALQLTIGLLIVAMGEIECMTTIIYRRILEPDYDDLPLSPRRKLAGYWLDYPLKTKVEDILGKLPETGEHLFLKEVLQEIDGLIAVRNTLAHSIVRYETSDTGALQLAAVRHVRSGLGRISKPEIITHIKQSVHLSDKLSEAIARVGFQLNRERHDALFPQD